MVPATMGTAVLSAMTAEIDQDIKAASGGPKRDVDPSAEVKLSACVSTSYYAQTVQILDRILYEFESIEKALVNERSTAVSFTVRPSTLIDFILVMVQNNPDFMTLTYVLNEVFQRRGTLYSSLEMLPAWAVDDLLGALRSAYGEEDGRDEKLRVAAIKLGGAFAVTLGAPGAGTLLSMLAVHDTEVRPARGMIQVVPLRITGDPTISDMTDRGMTYASYKQKAEVLEKAPTSLARFNTSAKSIIPWSEVKVTDEVERLGYDEYPFVRDAYPTMTAATLTVMATLFGIDPDFWTASMLRKKVLAAFATADRNVDYYGGQINEWAKEVAGVVLSVLGANAEAEVRAFVDRLPAIAASGQRCEITTRYALYRMMVRGLKLLEG